MLANLNFQEKNILPDIHICTIVSPGLYRCRYSPSFQQNFEPKEWVNGLGPRTSQRWLKFSKHAFFVTSPPEIPQRKMKNVCFLFWPQDLLKPWIVWIAL